MHKRSNEFTDPVSLFLVISLIAEMLGAYTALAPYRNYFIFAGALCLGIAFFFVPDIVSSARQAIKYPPTIPALVYIAWTMVLGFFSPYPEFARPEILRVFCGVIAYCLIIAHRPAARILPALLIFCGLLQSCYDFYLLGLRGGINSGFSYSAFATHQEVGSFLLIILFLCIPYLFPIQGRTASPEKQAATRLAALGAMLFFFLAFLISRCRSAWIGASIASLFSIGVAGWYAWRTHKVGLSKISFRDWLPGGILAAVTVICIVGFFAITQGNQSLSARTATFVKWHDEIGDRWAYWRAGLRMAQERPWTGWGPGSYLVIQHHWTGIGRSGAQVLRYGAGHFNVAHSYYAQWMADTGFTGLLIHCAVLASVVVAFINGMRRHLKRRSSLAEVVPTLAGFAAILASAIDAIASPSYNYHAIFLLWWMAIGIAVVRFQGDER